MTTIEVTATHLVVRLTGWDRVWALKSQLTIPLEHVRGAAIDPEAKTRRAGLRIPGTHLPGVVTAGSYRKDGKWWFWNVRTRKRVIVVDLDNERYGHLVLEVDDPAAAVATINNAVAKRAA